MSVQGIWNRLKEFDKEHPKFFDKPAVYVSGYALAAVFGLAVSIPVSNVMTARLLDTKDRDAVLVEAWKKEGITVPAKDIAIVVNTASHGGNCAALRAEDLKPACEVLLNAPK